MRKELAALAGERKKFRATFSRLGKKINYNGYSEDTILLTEVLDIETNQIVAGHVWFTYSKAFESVQLTEGTVIEFEARIKEYAKGYVNKRARIDNKVKDFKLSHPTRIKKV